MRELIYWTTDLKFTCKGQVEAHILQNAVTHPLKSRDARSRNEIRWTNVLGMH